MSGKNSHEQDEKTEPNLRHPDTISPPAGAWNEPSYTELVKMLSDEIAQLPDSEAGEPEFEYMALTTSVTLMKKLMKVNPNAWNLFIEMMSGAELLKD